MSIRNADQPAAPTKWIAHGNLWPGLSKREHIAIAAMQAIIQARVEFNQGYNQAVVANQAVTQADCLLSALAKTP